MCLSQVIQRTISHFCSCTKNDKLPVFHHQHNHNTALSSSPENLNAPPPLYRNVVFLPSLLFFWYFTGFKLVSILAGKETSTLECRDTCILVEWYHTWWGLRLTLWQCGPAYPSASTEKSSSWQTKPMTYQQQSLNYWKVHKSGPILVSIFFMMQRYYKVYSEAC